MEKEQKIYDLNKILSVQSYNRLMNYLTDIDKFGSPNNDFGCDGLALIGNGAKPIQVCQMFNLLADPEFINLRNDWGDVTGKENEFIPNIDDYVNGAKNSFSIKKNIVNNSGYMDFPLKNNYMTIDGQVKHIPFENGFDWEMQKSLIEQSMQATIPDFKIEDNKAFDDLFKYEEKTTPKFVSFGDENKTKRSAVAKIVHTSLSICKKMYKAVGVNFPFENQLKKYGPQHSTTVCYVSDKFKNQDLSNLDKFVAVVDALSYEKLKDVEKTKESRKELGTYSEDDQRKILMASKLIANWAVCMASNLGVENHKQMDNALKLELNSILGTLPQNNEKATTVIANISKDLTTEMFNELKHLDYAQIVEHRKALGLQYLGYDQENTFEDIKAQNPDNLLHEVLFGRTIPTEKIMTLENGNIQFKGYSPAFNELQPDAILVPAQPQPTLMPAQGFTAQPQSDSQNDDQQDKQPDSQADPTSKPTDRQTTNDVLPQKDDLIHIDPISGIVSATKGKKDAPKSTKEDEEFDINDGGAFNGSSAYIWNNLRGKVPARPQRKVDQSQIEKLREERKLRKEQANKQYPELLKLLEDKDEKHHEMENGFNAVDRMILMGYFVPYNTKNEDKIFEDGKIYIRKENDLHLIEVFKTKDGEIKIKENGQYNADEVGRHYNKKSLSSKVHNNDDVKIGLFDEKTNKSQGWIIPIQYVEEYRKQVDKSLTKEKGKTNLKSNAKIQTPNKSIKIKTQTPNPIYKNELARFKLIDQGRSK